MFKKKEVHEAEPQKVPRKKSFAKELLETAVSLFLMVIVLYLILHYVGQRVSVDGNSMNNTLKDHDQLLEDKFTYNFLREPKKGEIVILKLKETPDVHYVKRVIATPGDTIQIRDSVTYINGLPIHEPYIRDSVFSAGSASELITLGPDQYFVMGDNRNNSQDSRYALGLVDRAQITGRAIFRFWPLSSLGRIK